MTQKPVFGVETNEAGVNKHILFEPGSDHERVNGETHVGVPEPGAGFEDEGEGEVVGGKGAALAHRSVERNGFVEGVVGDEAADEGVVEKDVGVEGLGENDGGVLRGAEVEGRAQEGVDEEGVVVETKSEKATMALLHFLQPPKARSQTFL